MSERRRIMLIGVQPRIGAWLNDNVRLLCGSRMPLIISCNYADEATRTLFDWMKPDVVVVWLKPDGDTSGVRVAEAILTAHPGSVIIGLFNEEDAKYGIASWGGVTGVHPESTNIENMLHIAQLVTGRAPVPAA